MHHFARYIHIRFPYKLISTIKILPLPPYTPKAWNRERTTITRHSDKYRDFSHISKFLSHSVLIQETVTLFLMYHISATNAVFPAYRQDTWVWILVQLRWRSVGNTPYAHME
jgi:hypothetical protein